MSLYKQREGWGRKSPGEEGGGGQAGGCRWGGKRWLGLERGDCKGLCPPV